MRDSLSRKCLERPLNNLTSIKFRSKRMIKRCRLQYNLSLKTYAHNWQRKKRETESNKKKLIGRRSLHLISSSARKAQRRISTKNFKRNIQLNRTKSIKNQRVRRGFKDQKVKKEQEMKKGSETIMTWIW